MFKKLLKSVFNNKAEELHNETSPKEDSLSPEEETDTLYNQEKEEEHTALDNVKSIVTEIVDQLPLDKTMFHSMLDRVRVFFNRPRITLIRTCHLPNCSSKGPKEEKEEITEEKSANSSYTTALNSTYETDDELSKRLNDLLGKVEWEDKETEEIIQTPSNTKDYFDNSAQNTVTKLDVKSEDPHTEVEPLEQPKFDEDPADMSEEQEVPVQRGTYTIDWDNLEALDPFGGQPTKPKKNIINDTNNTVVEKNVENCEIEPVSHPSPPPQKDNNTEENRNIGQVNDNENCENEKINNNEQLNGKVENCTENNKNNANKTEEKETVKEKKPAKPKASISKFKRPAKPPGGFQQMDDIVIFASKSENKNSSEETEVKQSLPSNENVENEEPVKDDENNIISNVANTKTDENNSQEESFDGNQTLKETSTIQMNTSDEDRAMMPPPPSDFLAADVNEDFTPGEDLLIEV
ncbi:DgyrCDS12519 [Dimorphilus gyrociliatus]|uniref:DgyrCDS12519 n=1 Tax=Dimorphilus gyrociliatus TaxID=2664684 RepID=A0A7I8W6P7_9ANNE|nr:DgyrCDS12519 [Dimorphilus gyrociliatus]